MAIPSRAVVHKSLLLIVPLLALEILVSSVVLETG